MRVTLLLIILCILTFIYTMLVGGERFIETYGFSGPNLISRPWTLITSIFIHGNFEHLLSNILILFFFGIAVENELGAKKMLLIFLGGAIAGAFVSLFFYPWGTVSVGASAGIFALIGVGMLVKPLDLSFYPLLIPIPLALLGMLYTVYNAYYFFIAPQSNVSYIAHFGGLFIGLAFGFRKVGIKKGLLIMSVALIVLLALPIIWSFII